MAYQSCPNVVLVSIQSSTVLADTQGSGVRDVEILALSSGVRGSGSRAQLGSGLLHTLNLIPESPLPG